MLIEVQTHDGKRKIRVESEQRIPDGLYEQFVQQAIACCDVK